MSAKPAAAFDTVTIVTRIRKREGRYGHPHWRGKNFGVKHAYLTGGALITVPRPSNHAQTKRTIGATDGPKSQMAFTSHCLAS